MHPPRGWLFYQRVAGASTDLRRRIALSRPSKSPGNGHGDGAGGKTTICHSRCSFRPVVGPLRHQWRSYGSRPSARTTQDGLRVVDLRSDTATLPCKRLRAAMASAEVGDDVFGEDPTVSKLEECVAMLLGKEQGLLVPRSVRLCKVLPRYLV